MTSIYIDKNTHLPFSTCSKVFSMAALTMHHNAIRSVCEYTMKCPPTRPNHTSNSRAVKQIKSKVKRHTTIRHQDQLSMVEKLRLSRRLNDNHSNARKQKMMTFSLHSISQPRTNERAVLIHNRVLRLILSYMSSRAGAAKPL